MSTIPGAISRAEFEARDRASLGADTTVVAFCTIGARSGTYTKQLRQQGVKAFNLRGCILAWANEGQPLVTCGAPPGREPTPTRRLHVFAKSWALAPPDYEQARLCGCWSQLWRSSTQ